MSIDVTKQKPDVKTPRKRHSNMDTAKLVERFLEVHANGEYDYSKVTEYKGMCVPVTITCNRCGSTFEQLPTVHLRGSGCKPCGMMISGIKQTLTLEDVIFKVDQRGKLCYVSGEYINQHSVLVFACVKHKHKVKMLTYNAMTGRGCATCKGCKDTAGFVEAATAIHDGAYSQTPFTFAQSPRWRSYACDANVRSSRPLTTTCPARGVRCVTLETSPSRQRSGWIR